MKKKYIIAVYEPAKNKIRIETITAKNPVKALTNFAENENIPQNSMTAITEQLEKNGLIVAVGEVSTEIYDVYL